MSFVPMNLNLDMIEAHKRGMKPKAYHRRKKSHNRTVSLPTYTQINNKNSKVQEEKEQIDGDEMNKQGNELFKIGKYDEALSKYKDALFFFTMKHGFDHKTVATTLGNIGNVYWRIGDLKLSIKYLEKSLQTFKFVSGERKEENQIEIANTYHSLGIVYLLQNDFDKSLIAFNSALKNREEMFGNLSADVARTTDAIGTVYSKMNQENEAITYFETALQTKLTIFGSGHFSVVVTMKHLANSFSKKSQYHLALAKYEEILGIQVNNSKVFSRAEVDETLDSIGNLRAKLEDE